MKYPTLVLCLVAVTLSGCGRLGRVARVDPAAVVAQRKNTDCPYVAGVPGDDPIAIDLDCYHFPNEPVKKTKESKNDLKLKAANDPNKPTELNDPSKPTQKSLVDVEHERKLIKGYTAYELASVDKKYRDQLEGMLLLHADTICEAEKGSIFANEAAVNTAFDFLSSGLSAASTIVGGDEAKSILSGLAGFSTAGKSHVTANVYRNQIVPAITNVIEAERAKILTTIETKRSQELDKYPASAMIRLVNSYHQACSFQNGLQILLKASVNKAGSDAIIRSINVQFAISQLRQAIAAEQVVPKGQTSISSAAQKNIDDYQAKLGELTLELINIGQQIQGNANTSTDVKTPTD